MKLTKKQVVVGGVVAVLLAGGITAGAVHSHNVKVEKAKQVEMDKKILEDTKRENNKLVSSAKEALKVAQKTPNTNNLILAGKAISRVNNDKEHKQLSHELQSIKKRVTLETEAKKAVAEYQRDATNADKLKKAQTAVSKLTSDYSKTLKAKLTKDISTSKAQADKAQKAEEAKKSGQTAKAVDNSNQTAKSNNSEVNQAQAENGTVTDPAPIDNGGASNNNAYQPTPQAPVGGGSGNGNASNPNPPSTGGGNTVTPPTGGGNSGGNGNTGGNNGGGTVTPPPAETFTGWVKRNGVIVWQQGGFKTLDEAGIAAIHWMNDNADFDGDYSSGAY